MQQQQQSSVVEVQVLPEVQHQHQPQQMMLIGSSPENVVENATKMANILKKIIDDKKLSVNLRGQSHVKCEGWTTLGALLGVYPQESAVVVHDDGSVTATIELRTLDGRVISRGSGHVGMDEKTWAGRPAYARRSMAITRATGKAFRLGFSWVVALAGYNPTPAEEMPIDDEQPQPQPRNVEPVRYDNSPASKRRLAEICAKHGVTKREQLVEIAKGAEGKDWASVEQWCERVCRDVTEVEKVFNG